LIATVPDYPVDVIYLPYLNGERSPFVDPLARGAFIGLDARTSSGVMTRAVLTGVAYGYRHAVEELVPGSVESLVITGGGARSETWMQIFADVLGVPVSIASDAANVGVRGAVIAAKMQRGLIMSYIPENSFPIEKTMHPSLEFQQFYDDQYNIFTDLYPALKDAFAAMGSIRRG
jgi:xylulokinase